MLTRGYYYERRKNYYKNQNKPRKEIVSITYLAQSIIAIALQEPNNAKGRPSTLLNDDEGYRRVFNPDFPWEVFYECIKFMKTAETYAKKHLLPDDVDATPYNFRYHLAMFATAVKSGVPQPKGSSIPSLGLDEIDDDFFASCMSHIWEIYKEFRANGSSEATIMRAPDFDKALQSRLKEILIEKTIKF